VKRAATTAPATPAARLAWTGALAALMLVLLCAASAASAHLMVAQRGTLNFVGTGAFLVLSLPVSAFDGVDDDGDGRLSFAELKAHRAAIEATVVGRVRLADAHGVLPLQGVMLSLSPPDDAPASASAPAAQLVVMGRYALPRDAAEMAALQWAMPLFGRQPGEQHLVLNVTRGTQQQELLLRPGQAAARLLPGGPGPYAALVGWWRRLVGRPVEPSA
jgi:hypothetical protein